VDGSNIAGGFASSTVAEGDPKKTWQRHWVRPKVPRGTLNASDRRSRFSWSPARHGSVGRGVRWRRAPAGPYAESKAVSASPYRGPWAAEWRARLRQCRSAVDTTTAALAPECRKARLFGNGCGAAGVAKGDPVLAQRCRPRGSTPARCSRARAC